MKLTRQPQINLTKDAETNRALLGVWQELAREINGLLGFGSPATGRENLTGAWYQGVTPGAPDTDFTITHSLGYIPVGFLLVNTDKACILYQGSVTWTLTQITLKCNVASASITVFVI